MAPFRTFLRNAVPKCTAVGYTLSGRLSRRVKGILSNSDIFYDSYVAVYGFYRGRVYTPFRTIYLGTPYVRGYIYKYGAALTHTPITLFLNLDSRCIRRGLVEEAIDLVNEGVYSLYLAIPFTSNMFSTLYRDKVYKIFKSLGLGIDLLHPSYTLVVGKSRIFKDTPYTLWSTEILAVVLVELALGRNMVRVEDVGCADDAAFAVQGIEDIYVERLAIDIIGMLVDRKAVDEKQARELLEMVKSS